jgi:hypothetical protein
LHSIANARGFGHSGFAARYTELRTFAAKFRSTVERTVENYRHRACARHRIGGELFAHSANRTTALWKIDRRRSHREVLFRSVAVFARRGLVRRIHIQVIFIALTLIQIRTEPQTSPEASQIARISLGSGDGVNAAFANGSLA